MTWEAELDVLRQPLIDNWDFEAVPVSWPGREFDPADKAPKTGDKTDPSRWVMFEATYPGSDYLTFTTRVINGVLDIGCFMEPIAGDRFLRLLVDDLESYYGAGDTAAVTFHVDRSTVDTIGLDGDWWRWDWRCPFERHE